MTATGGGIRGRVLSLWESVSRPGVKDLVVWLEASDFFSAPCSTQHHLCQRGGLALHSLHVYELLSEKIKRYGLKVQEETAVICGLGHDLCKVNFYATGIRNVKEGGRWVEKEVCVVQDRLPLGHGEKSVSVLQDFIALTEEEKLAIRWHMGPFDPGVHFGYPGGYAYAAAAAKCPLVILLFTADYEAARLIDRGLAGAADGCMGGG